MGMAMCLKCGIWHHGECEEVPDVSKLPAWPESIDAGASVGQEFDWLDQSLTAALARMEALVEMVKELRRRRRNTPLHIDGRIDDEIDVLLAACAREEGR
jgi:hypothetical protein